MTLETTCLRACLTLVGAALTFNLIVLGADVACRALIRKWRKTP